jgi:serine/threonine-protein kinase
MALNPDHTLLNGHYRIERLLGRGGFGFVYEARDTLLNEKVAIKELIPALVGDEAMLKRFLAEAKATMRLRHKRIVGTHNVFSEGGNYYIAMEYMPGGSLEERLREHGPLPMSEAVRIAAEVCEGLACAHEEGVVHCDLKPHNILFDATGQAKVADFGIAHVSGEMLTRSWMTPAGFVAGTLPYMSPEQADGVRDDPRVDVYAVGAVLYRTLTGCPYLEFDQRETPGATADNVYRIRREPPQPPSTHTPRLPAWLDAAVLKALAKRPEERYANVEALRAALLRQQMPAAALPSTRQVPERRTPTPTPTSARQTPPGPSRSSAAAARQKSALPTWFWPAVGGAAVLAVVLIVAIATLIGGGEGPRERPTEEVAVVHTVRAPEPTEVAVAVEPEATRPVVVDIPVVAPEPTEAAARTDTPEPPTADAARTRSKDGMEMVYVPAGEFTMGSTDADIDAILAECSDCERDWFTREQPQHTVTLDAFWIDETEVTNAQYARFLNALGGHKGKCQGQDCIRTKSENNDSHIRYQGGQYVAESGYEDHPMIEVSWYGAQAYCEWAGARLPTEAEWEKAARGTEGRIYPWGNTFDSSKVNLCDRNCEFDWRDSNADDGYARTAPVGNYSAGASPYGALDMAGNVWEWVADWYAEDYYANSPKSNPKGPNSGPSKVLRGGSWVNVWYYVRAAGRGTVSYPDLTYSDIGFRCAGSPGG